MSSQPSRPQADSLAEPEQASRAIPHYLYRVYSVKSPESNGCNSDVGFASAAAQNNEFHSSLAAMPYDMAQSKLRKHLAWTMFMNDEFISWTSSLLWALQFAVRKTKNAAEHELRICVLKTSRFDRNTFFSAPQLIQEYGLSEFSDIIDEYHTTTYLVHGSLNVRNCSSTVSLACLREHGLFDLLPELDDESWKQKLFLRVRDLRQTIVSATDSLSLGTCQRAFQVASSYGAEWTMAMMIAFLALPGLPHEPELLLRMIREIAVPTRDFLGPFPSCEGHYIDVPELANFTEMMNWGFAEMQNVRLQQMDGLGQFNAKLNALSLGSDGVADVASDTLKTMPAEDPSPPVLPQQTTTRALRRVTATVILPTLGMVPMITVTVAGSGAQRLDITIGTTVDGDNGTRPAADPIPSSTTALGSVRHIIVGVHVSEDACDGCSETEGLSYGEHSDIGQSP